MQPQSQRSAYGHDEIALDERAADRHTVSHRERGAGKRAAAFDRRSHGDDDGPAELLPGSVVAPGLAKARVQRFVGVVHPPAVYRDRVCADPG